MVSFVLAFAAIVGGCSDVDCIPEPEQDESAPVIFVHLDYRSPSGTEESVEHSSGQPSHTVEADPAAPVTIRYAGIDSAGVRSLFPALMIQQTVGIGVERQHVEIAPVSSGCPVRELTYVHTVPGTGERRALVLTATAANWTGRTAAVEPLTVRMQ